MSEKPRANQAAKITVIRDPSHPEAGDGGIVPPYETRWKPGQSGNPRGRPSYGAAVVEYVNELRDTPEDDLERIARDRRGSPTKREAAISILTRLADAYDLADFADAINRGVTLTDLRDKGIPVRRLKRFRRREDKHGVTVDLELSERGDRAIDRILDRTLGRAMQSVAVAHVDARLDMAREAVNRLSDSELATLERLLAKAGLTGGK